MTATMVLTACTCNHAARLHTNGDDCRLCGCTSMDPVPVEVPRTTEPPSADPEPDAEPPGPPLYSSLRLCELVGCTYRQLDHWIHAGYLADTPVGRKGSGNQRQFTPDELDLVHLAVQLIDSGFVVARAFELSRVIIRTGSPCVISAGPLEVTVGFPRALTEAAA